MEDAGEEGPAEGDVGDEDGGGRFANVPVEVDEGAVGFGEVVVAVEDCGEDLLGGLCVSGCMGEGRRLEERTTKTPRLKTPPRISFL